MNGTGNGYLSGNMLVAYPFEDGQCLSWSSDADAMQQALQKCFVDAGVYLLNDADVSLGWPCIGDFAVSADALGFSISAGGSSLGASISPSKVKFPVASGKAPWGYYTVTLSSEGISDFIRLCRERQIYPPTRSPSSVGSGGVYSLRVCARCVTVSRRGLNSLMVYDGVHPMEEGPHFVLSGDVVFRPGNNMRLSEVDGEAGSVEVNAVPGAGLGRNPCRCENDKAGRSALADKDGIVRLFNDTCYDIEPVSEGVSAAHTTIKIHAKCTACCTCDMFRSIVDDRLAVLADVIRGAKRGTDGLLGVYEDAVQKFNDRIRHPSMEDVEVSLSGMPVGANISPVLDGTKVLGKMGRCVFTATVRNSSYFVVEASVVSITGTDAIIEASAAWSDEDGSPLSRTGDSGESVSGRVYAVYPGRSLLITFVSRKNAKVHSVDTGSGFTGSIAVSFSYRKEDSSKGSLGSVTKSIDV